MKKLTPELLLGWCKSLQKQTGDDTIRVEFFPEGFVFSWKYKHGNYSIASKWDSPCKFNHIKTMYDRKLEDTSNI